MQCGAPDAATQAGGEVRLRATAAGEVADPSQVVARWVDPQVEQGLQTARHQTLSAGLVDDSAARLHDERDESTPRGVEGGGKADRAAADDEHIDRAGLVGHGAAASSRRAWFSTRIRSASRAAFATVKTRAVTQAVWTSGSARPSATTAT